MIAREDTVRDIVIVGSGAGGAPLALCLSQAGFDVLVLEKGVRHERSDYIHDELFTATSPGFFVPDVREDPHVLVDYDSPQPGPTPSNYGWTATCVGGGTTHMGGTFCRFHPDDFMLRTRCGDFESIEDWPYKYEDLEPYYTQAEWAIGVSGAAGTSPFEGFRSRPYPMPPLASHPLARLIDDACRKLGVHAFPTPRAINSQPYDGRPACTHCNVCSGYGCPTGARGGSVLETLLPRAEATDNCEIRPSAMVREITVGPNGRATGCLYLDDAGVEHRVRAKLVCICCSAVESARLLLLSRSPLFPDGIANGNGLVGRNFQFHCSSSGRARFRYDTHTDIAWGDQTSFLTRSVMDHYFLPPRVSEFPKGGLLKFELLRAPPISAAQEVAWQGRTRPIWGEQLAERLWERFRETRDVTLEVFQDFIPNDRTLVVLDTEVTDKWDLPSARMHVATPDHHRVAGRWLVHHGLEILREAGADTLITGNLGYPNTVMAHGTCRAGTDPTRSVLNAFCRSHDVPNLFVVDGSFMPTSGGVPTTLTIIANSFRTADYIRDRARTGDLA